MSNQASVEQAHGQVGPFNVGGVLAEQRQNCFRLTENDAQFRIHEASMFVAMLDHLQILPAGLRPFARRRSTVARVFGNLTIDGHHRVIDPAPAVRHRGRRGFGVSAGFQRLEDGLRGFRFGLGNAAGDAESGVNV